MTLHPWPPPAPPAGSSELSPVSFPLPSPFLSPSWLWQENGFVGQVTATFLSAEPSEKSTGLWPQEESRAELKGILPRCFPSPPAETGRASPDWISTTQKHFNLNCCYLGRGGSVWLVGGRGSEILSLLTVRVPAENIKGLSLEIKQGIPKNESADDLDPGG